MIAAIADTHAVLWYLYNDKRLSPTASQFFDDAVRDGNQIGISAISLVEIVYLSEKGSIASQAPSKVIEAIQSPQSLLVDVSLNANIVQALQLVPWADVPDMPDRIIVATAVYLNVPVISRDSKIQAANLKTIW